MVVTAPSIMLLTDSPEATQEVAAVVAGLCHAGDVVLLVGDLGTGKTTFAQGLGRALGVLEPVVSPTFTLVRQYVVPEGAHRKAPLSESAHTESSTSLGPGSPIHQFVHADLYRLSHRHEVADLGIGQLVENGVAVVEWGEAAEPVLGDDWLRVDLDFVASGEETRRAIGVTAHGGTWPRRWPEVEAALRPWGNGQ
jgi:tRNA threonylcarbamoyladenosine biosynthesis protein TsaE